MSEQQTFVKATVTLPQESLEIVRRMAEKANISMAEVIRRAITANKLLHDAVEEGALILIKDKHNSLSQIVLQ